MFSALFLFTIALQNRLTTSYEEIAPPDCSPCQCLFQKPIILLDCHNASLTTEHFKKIWDFDLHATFRKMGDFAFYMFPTRKRLLSVELNVIESDISSLDLTGYDNLRILTIENSRIDGDKSVMEVPTNLKVLNVTNSSLSGLSLPATSHLIILHLDTNVLEEIITHPTLKSISLKTNRISTFKTTSCSVMVNLTYLDLSDNLIEEIPEDAFACILPMEDVHSETSVALFLSRNKIESIYKDAFKGIKLSKIDLSYNKLKSLDIEQFNWRRLQYTNLQFNPWRCDCKAQWMLDDLLPELYATQQNVLFEFRCATPKKFENKQFAYWLDRSVDVFCGAPSTMYFTAAGREFEMDKVIFITVIILSAINIVLILAVLIVCCKYGVNFSTKKDPEFKNNSEADDSKMLIQKK